VTSTNPTAGILPASAADTLSTSTGSTTSTAGMLGKDDFLKLLVGQLKNQDPMAPSDSQQWIGQMAQMTELEQVTNIASSSTKTVNALNRSGNLALIGHTVTYAGDNGAAVTGTVQQVDIDDKGNATLTVDGTTGIDSTKVTQIR
jgi:flagellar basal-body rod modification protein FlgD